MEYEAVKYVEGFVENIIFRNEDNGYTVFDITYNGEEVTCVGVLSYISAGEFIAAQGEFVKHPVYYMQFKIKSYEFRAPDDAKSVKRYLSSGAIKGIGEKMAENIVNKFGDDTFRIMEEEPERLAEIKGISIKKAMDIAAQLMDKRDVRRAMMFMQEFGISMKLANKIYTKYGQNIYTILKENPYRLADDIDGIGFKIADEIAAKAGIKVDSAFRIKSGIFYVLSQAVCVLSGLPFHRFHSFFWLPFLSVLQALYQALPSGNIGFGIYCCCFSGSRTTCYNDKAILNSLFHCLFLNFIKLNIKTLFNFFN